MKFKRLHGCPYFQDSPKSPKKPRKPGFLVRKLYRRFREAVPLLQLISIAIQVAKDLMM